MLVRVKVKLLREGSMLPEYAKAGDSGADLRWHDETLSAAGLGVGQTKVFWTNVCVELPEGFEAQIRPRSSLSAKGIWCALGTIDQGYRGELGVTLTNMSGRLFTVERGDRIAQLVIAPVVQAHFEQADVLGGSERGQSGFGSTGK